jgi:hypothetical protein
MYKYVSQSHMEFERKRFTILHHNQQISGWIKVPSNFYIIIALIQCNDI